jgi:hypothetical protein
MKSTTTTKTLTALLTLTATLAVTAQEKEESWIDRAISPVANPLFFESAFIQSEVRPIFAYHEIDDGFVGGFARVYALQLRYAVTERLAIIATKDGYIQLEPAVPGLVDSGWADIAAGVKYALIDDRENEFILTPGMKFEFTTGQSDVFQGNGDGEFNIFVSAAKGFGNLHLSGSGGFRIPVDMGAENAFLHYSLMVDYYTCKWFIPFAGLNGMTVLSDANALPFNVEGFDLINFGSSNASGFNQIVLTAGFRSRLCEWADLGFAYESSVTTPRGLFDTRYTADFIVRF